MPKGLSIDGATLSSLTVSNVGSADVGDYRVVMTNTYGSITSEVARLAVALPRLTSQVLDDASVRLSLPGVSGCALVLERTFCLSPPHWIPQATNVPLDESGVVFTNIPDMTTNNFWRVRLDL